MEALEGRKGIGRKTIKPDRPATVVNIKTIQQAMNPEAGGGALIRGVNCLERS